jgi:acetolactate synthase-1/2/3 large subunit
MVGGLRQESGSGSMGRDYRGDLSMTSAGPATVAEAYLALLKARGIDWLFANAGTDFAPLIEGMVRGARGGLAMPEPVVVPHENVAVGMAHGYYLVTGRPQAVMCHVNVGTANALMGLLNAARDNVPIFFTSGRTPVTEAGRVGSRDLPIHWGQEMRDQAGMLRECVKWDYELRYGEQIEAIVDRALAIAMAAPRGPVYLSLPREALAEPLEGFAQGGAPLQATPAPPAADAAAIDQAAAILARAQAPLLITARAGRSLDGAEALARLADRFALPVVEFWPPQNSLPTTHPMHGGFDVGPWLAEADAVLVVDSLVPWIPSRDAPPPGCPVIQIGPDPTFAALPMRGFPATLAIQADSAAALDALAAALARLRPDAATLAARRERIAARNRARREAAREAARRGDGAPMSAAWISHCLDQAKDDDALLFNELGADPEVLTFERPASFFSHSLAGGLGWGLPAALGAQLADRERLVIAAVGDGSYMFANPVACHQVGEALALPVLTVVFNNGVWNAVRKSTQAVYPEGHAVRANRMPLTSLEPAPRYEMIVAASGGYGERVEAAHDLPAALERALAAVRKERRQALLNVMCR